MPLDLSSTVSFVASMAEIEALEPSITRWQRLEAQIAALDLAPGLEARVADPLWLVGRQWQFAELRGEDAGSPIQVALEGEKVGVRLAQGSPRAAEPLAAPDGLLEPVVEAEEARASQPALSAQAGLDFERALALNGVHALADAFRALFPFAPPAGFDATSDAAGARLLALAQGRAIDAAALAGAFLASSDAAGGVTSLPAGVSAAPEQLEPALAAATQWLAAWRDLVLEPGGGALWRDDRLEYAFALEAPHAQGTTEIVAREYHGGRLDWWTFDTGVTRATAGQAEAVAVKTLPVPIRYPGMPAQRYWECEDGSVNLARPKGGPASISLMLMLEYALVASTDWFQVPLELDYGCAFRMGRLVVTDTFGVAAELKRAQAGPAGWALFELAATAEGAGSPSMFVLPPVVAGALESEPIEEVRMFRDETANLVWGVERRTPGLTAEPIERNHPAAHEQVLSQRLEEPEGVDAATLYRLQSAVALNWYPFAPRQKPDSPPGVLLLSRRNLRRVTFGEDGSATEFTARPHGQILGGHEDRFEVEEHEVPRSGLILTRTFQCARTVDGRRVVWLGRHKRVGHGEGHSDLRYDLLESVKAAR